MSARGGRGRGPGPTEAASEPESWVVGRKAVAEALAAGGEAGGLSKLWVADDPQSLRWFAPLEHDARRAGTVVARVPRAALDRLVPGVVHQGVAGMARQGTWTSIEDLLAPRPRPHLLVLVDGIEDPRNLGAMIRTAAAAGADGMIVPDRRSASLGPSASKAAAGAMARLPLARARNVQRALEAMHDAGIWTLGLEAGARPLWSGTDLVRPTCVVVGGEGRGLSRLARERCDDLAGIPLARGSESLNASIALAIALFEAVRQRSAPGEPPVPGIA